jgi:hypothetical protein
MIQSCCCAGRVGGRNTASAVQAIVNFAVSPFRFLVLADEWERTFDHGVLDDANDFVRRIISGANRFVFSPRRTTLSRAESPSAISANKTVSREFEQFLPVMICAPAAKRRPTFQRCQGRRES